MTISIIWVLLGRSTDKTLRLLDSGNAILVEIVTGITVWQSFHYPTDTFLPGMKLDSLLYLTSWTNETDPSPGSFVFQRAEDTNQYVIWNSAKTRYQWKSGSGSTKSFDVERLFIDAYYLLSNTTKPPNKTNYCNTKQHKPEINYCNYTANYFVSKNYPRLLMNHTGNIQYYSWTEHAKQWVLNWQVPEDECSIYRVCGKFSVCNISDTFNCSCLFGFEPISPLDMSAGCKRTYPLCAGNDEYFFNMSMINIENPNLPVVYFKNELDCKKRCLENCDCGAYSFTAATTDEFRSGRSNDANSSCWIWESDLNNLQANGRHNISIRVSKGNLNHAKGSSGEEAHILIVIMAILLILLLGSLGYIYYRRSIIGEQGINSSNSERWAIELLDPDQSRTEDTEGLGVLFFQLESILAATDNFSEANKLGRGGFGPVYKGKLIGGQEVAVKRLSSVSVQGLEEFRNEVMLIAKLQHRNLVRLLGYCMKGNEKILVYEYMPNKSLDAFIFDGEPRITLDWAKRYEIIRGISRGLLYLHQDSRLRIIHRDLKTSNILLDGELNPKISDFGLAKIVQGKEMEATTNRVVGTYGYMAPEYALEGFFSVKSDVFSFGVVVLETISGKKNTRTLQPRQNLSLLGYAWNLWKEGMPFELMDQRLVESSNSIEVLKCIIVGLLCVQEDPGDRPTMSNVVLMLAGDITSLPNPKQPAFVTRKTLSTSSSSSFRPDQTITLTLPEGR
ncbi:G-type lectin S-receptor-like serine/threonine-protein kinase At4g03230 [Bidens hawaiensis]|uniref:G-type lectin S-receptor-like serine/threonine-protein kinase At4g03230 n=1 Tax=Bidens hawaiensis TaxID=980011 RepID=UPI00404B2525